MDIEISLPAPTAPGFLKFLRRMAVCQSVLTNPGMAAPEQIDEAVDAIVALVSKPESREQAREAVMELSVMELNGLFASLVSQPDPKA